MSQFFQGPAGPQTPGAQASPAMALLAQAIAGAQQAQPPLSQDPTAEARYTPRQVYESHVRSSQIGAGTGRNNNQSPLGMHVREVADDAGRSAHKAAMSASGFDPNADYSGQDIPSPSQASPDQLAQYYNGSVGQRAGTETTNQHNANMLAHAENAQDLEGLRQPASSSPLLQRLAAQTALGAGTVGPASGANPYQLPVTNGDQMTVGRGTPGEAGYNEATTVFGGPNGPVTTQTMGGTGKPPKNVSSADWAAMSPIDRARLTQDQARIDAGQATKTHADAMTQWKSQNAANLQERNIAYRNLQGAQKKQSNVGESVLSSQEDRQKAQDTLTQAQTDYENADQKYTTGVGKIPEMPESQQPPTAQPTAQPHSALVATPANVGILQRLLQQRQQSQQTRTFNGQQYQIGQTINVGGKAYTVSEFDPDTGEPHVVPQ